MRRLRWPALAVAAALLGGAGLTVGLAGCGDDGGASHAEHGGSDGAPVVEGQTVRLYRSPTCGCCQEYEAYLRREGFEVDGEVVDDLASIRAEHDVPNDAAACHTAVIGDYTVEGHVPVEAIQRLLQEQPAIDGIALPGMPAGSPGMGGELEEPLEILALEDGTTSDYMAL